MCGIAGVVDFDGRPVREEQILAMCGALTHRGPDGQGLYLAPGVGLGMRRLSIIDLKTGAQPVQNEDGSAWVVLNDEIYNYRDLRHGLETRGHRFYTSSDTESIIHLYEDRGRACVEALRGMFAFAVWDRARRTLLLARDRLGIKPLFYTEIGRRLAFASELKALLALRGVRREVDPAMLDAYLALQYVPGPRTALQGIDKLPPGHLLVAENGRVRVERYWQLAPRPEQPSPVDVREAVTAAVRRRLIADVPLGALLSGGIDSSIVVAVMAQAQSGRVKTFTVGFGDPRYDERGWARDVAERFGTEHEELVVEPDPVDTLPRLGGQRGKVRQQPLGHPHARERAGCLEPRSKDRSMHGGRLLKEVLPLLKDQRVQPAGRGACLERSP